MKNAMRAERNKIPAEIILISAGIIYLIWIRVTGIYLPCVFRAVTGLKCPGCGISHMFTALVRLDFAGAFSENPFLLVTLPLLGAESLYALYLRWNGRKMPRWNTVLLVVYLAALVLFGILRNLGFCN